MSKKNIKKKDSKFVKKIKQNMYQWHRTIGIITIIPVILWTLSGLMHPFMAHFFKPEIAHEKLETVTIPQNKLSLSIQEVLRKKQYSAVYQLPNRYFQQHYVLSGKKPYW